MAEQEVPVVVRQDMVDGTRDDDQRPAHAGVEVERLESGIPAALAPRPVGGVVRIVPEDALVRGTVGVDEHEPAPVRGHAVLSDGHPVVRQAKQVTGLARGELPALGELPSNQMTRSRATSRALRWSRTPEPASQHQGRHQVSADVAWLSCSDWPVHRSSRWSWTAPSTARWWMSQRPSRVIDGT